MIYAGILAGGKGSRMNSNIPKQFIELDGKPIIIHTIEKFLNVEEVDKIVISVVEDYIDYTKELISKYLDTDKIVVIKGGSSRSESLMNVCNYIGNDSDDIILTHDAARPFVSEKIIKDNIDMMKKGEYDAAGTFIPAIDTIAEFKDGLLSNIPLRDNLYNVQTPQTFRVNELLDSYNSLTEEEKSILTDATKIYLLKGKKVGLVLGDRDNIKITTDFDLKLGNLIVSEKECKCKIKNKSLF